MGAIVTVQCPKCKAERDIYPGEIPEGDLPMCDHCLFPMFAISARAWVVRTKRSV